MNIVLVYNMQGWTCNVLKVAPQKQNARAQYAERNCAYKLFKAHNTATINAKNASFHNKIFKRKERKRNFFSYKSS
jgi:hypothetical protein